MDKTRQSCFAESDLSAQLNWRSRCRYLNPSPRSWLITNLENGNVDQAIAIADQTIAIADQGNEYADQTIAIADPAIAIADLRNSIANLENEYAD